MDITRRTALQAVVATGGAGALGLAAPARALAAYPTLRRGSSGAAVRTLQARLGHLRYWCGAVDGVFGGLTEQAVFALQKAAGITRDGVVGPATWSRLSAGVRPSVRTRTGTWFEVDKARQLCLYVVDGRLMMTLDTSTGSGHRYYSRGAWHVALTPSGSFRVYRKVNGWDDGPLGALWRPAYFNGGIALHGYGSVPAYPASHGCVRVSISAMDMLWSSGRVPIGRRVTVY